MRRSSAALAAIVALAAALRILGLDAKGFWEDEAAVAGAVQHGFGGMIDQISESEATPPLYYVLAWGWAKLFGAGEVGLRSLSVLVGTLTVPAAFLAARKFVSERVGLLTAALVAVNPLLIWFSQEGRSYALFVLLATVALFFFARSLEEPNSRNLALWAGFCALAAVTHYFGAFPFLAEAAWLLARHPARRSVRVAIAMPVLTGLALLPFAIAEQGVYGTPDWISEIGLLGRVIQIPGVFLVGLELSYPLILAVAAAAAAAAAIGLARLLSRGDRREQRGALVAGTVGVANILVPLLLVLPGFDYLIYRSVLTALIPFATVVAAGLGAKRAGPLGLGAAGALVAISVGVVVATASEPKFGRDAWREAAEAVGGPTGPRAVVATPGRYGTDPLVLVYLRGSEDLEKGSARVSEIDLLALPRRGLGALANPELPEVPARPPPPAPGFRLVRSDREEHFVLFVYRASAPRRVSRAQLLGADLDPDEKPVVLLERPG